MRIPESLPPRKLQLSGFGSIVTWARIDQHIWEELRYDFVRCATLNRLLNPDDAACAKGLFLGGSPGASEIRVDQMRLHIPGPSHVHIGEEHVLEGDFFIVNVETEWSDWDEFEISPGSYDPDKIRVARNRLTFADGLCIEALQLGYEGNVLTRKRRIEYPPGIATGQPILVAPDGCYYSANVSG